MIADSDSGSRVLFERGIRRLEAAADATIDCPTLLTQLAKSFIQASIGG